jgi:hypothetical protein
VLAIIWSRVLGQTIKKSCYSLKKSIYCKSWLCCFITMLHNNFLQLDQVRFEVRQILGVQRLLHATYSIGYTLMLYISTLSRWVLQVPFDAFNHLVMQRPVCFSPHISNNTAFTLHGAPQCAVGRSFNVTLETIHLMPMSSGNVPRNWRLHCGASIRARILIDRFCAARIDFVSRYFWGKS